MCIEQLSQTLGWMGCYWTQLERCRVSYWYVYKYVFLLGSYSGVRMAPNGHTLPVYNTMKMLDNEGLRDRVYKTDEATLSLR